MYINTFVFLIYLITPLNEDNESLIILNDLRLDINIVNTLIGKIRYIISLFKMFTILNSHRVYRVVPGRNYLFVFVGQLTIKIIHFPKVYRLIRK